MGFMNQRAICPKCGGKIHTQARGIGHLTWMRSGVLVKTGSECQWCGIKLSGKVGFDNKAIAADDPRAKKALAKQQAGVIPKQDQFLEIMELLREGKKIKAIKRYKAITGKGLRESKDFIDKLGDGDGDHITPEEYERLKEIERAGRAGSTNSLTRTEGGSVLSIDAPSSVADEIKKFAELRASGVITEEEFQIKRTELLNS